MRIKKFADKDISRLMLRVKKELGPDAVIISTSLLADGQTELIAAIEEEDLNFDYAAEEPEIMPAAYNDAVLREALAYHAPTAEVQAKILAMGRQYAAESHTGDDGEILLETLQKLLSYYDVFDREHTVLMFTGIQGSGKTTALIKIATLAKMKKLPTAIISTDNVRAGSNSQLKAFADILEADFTIVKNADILYDKVLSAQGEHPLVLIDTPGINPFSSKEVAKLAEISRAVNCRKILTMDAGRNAEEAAEAAEIFASLDIDCLLPTRLDLTRRLGGILSIAAGSHFKLGYASVSASIVKGLARVTNQSLAKLILD